MLELNFDIPDYTVIEEYEKEMSEEYDDINEDSGYHLIVGVGCIVSIEV